MIMEILAGFISGVVGAMGFGGGGVLILYLVLYKDMPQLNAQGINLLFFIPTAVTALIKHHKNNLIDKKMSLTFIIYGIIGVGIGYILINYLDEHLTRKIFSMALISVGIKSLIIKNKRKNSNNHE